MVPELIVFCLYVIHDIGVLLPVNVIARRSRIPGSYSVVSILDQIVALIDDLIESVRNTSIEEQSLGLLLRLSEAQRPFFHLLGPELHQEIISFLSEMLSLLRRLTSNSTHPYRVATVHEGINSMYLDHVHSCVCEYVDVMM